MADVNIFYGYKYLCLSGFRILFNGCLLSSAELGSIAAYLYKDKSYFWGISKSYHVVDKDNHKDSHGSNIKIYYIYPSQFKITIKIIHLIQLEILSKIR